MSLPLISIYNPLALEFENKLISSPYSVLTWLDYIKSAEELLIKQTEAKIQTPQGKKREEAAEKETQIEVNMRVLYERAVRLLPGR